MSSIVLGVGASHSTLMNTHWHEVAGVDRAERFRAALDDAQARVRAAQPDAVVIIGSNHFRGFWLDLMPMFTIGVGECTMSGESGTPEGPLPIDTELARHLLGATTDASFDVAFSAKLQVDHGITHAVQHLLPEVGIPVVPIVVNVFAPPLPSLARCEALGRALAQAVATDGRSKRVVVIGSGGLSHALPFPKWDEPTTDDERFLVDAWTNGREHWREFDTRRRAIIRAATPRTDEQLDGTLLDLAATGRLAELALWSTEQLEERGGNGAHEIRTWLMAAAMCGHHPATVLAYSPMPEWLTGMAVAVFETAGVEDAT